MKIKPALKATSRRATAERRREVVARCQAVKKRGDRALVGPRKRGAAAAPAPITYSRADLRRAFRRLPPRSLSALEVTCRHAGAMARRELAALKTFHLKPSAGVTLSSALLPVESVGILVPPQSVESLISGAIGAAVAGVERRVVCSSAVDGQVSGLLLAAAYMCEVTSVLAVGGVGAAAALAYGTDTIGAVDRVVGLGDERLGLACTELADHCDFLCSTGPSTLLVVADRTASPEFLAADLLARAEADPAARLAVVSTSEELLRRAIEIGGQRLRALPGDAAARGPWRRAQGVVVGDLKAAARIANDFAPQRLALHVQRPADLLGRLRHYGSLVLGDQTPPTLAGAVLGGPELLPASGSVAASGPISVGSFLRRVAHLRVDPSAYLRLARAAEALADLQQRPLAAEALAVRVTPLDRD